MTATRDDANAEAERDVGESLHIVYLHLDENAAGFRWQVRGHDLPEPLAAGADLFASIHTARDAGLAALERVCRQFGSQVYVRGA